MKHNSLVALIACIAALCVGCQTTPVEGPWSKATEEMLVHGQLERIVRCPLLFLEQGKMHVMAIGEIKNETTLVSNDNVEFMKATIASELTNLGVVMISTAENGRNAPPKGRNAIAPTLKLFGKLTQRDSRDKEGSLQHEFAFELSIVELASGRQIWSSKNVAVIRDNGRISHCGKVVTKSSQCV